MKSTTRSVAPHLRPAPGLGDSRLGLVDHARDLQRIEPAAPSSARTTDQFDQHAAIAWALAPSRRPSGFDALGHGIDTSRFRSSFSPCSSRSAMAWRSASVNRPRPSPSGRPAFPLGGGQLDRSQWGGYGDSAALPVASDDRPAAAGRGVLGALSSTLGRPPPRMTHRRAASSVTFSRSASISGARRSAMSRAAPASLSGVSTARPRSSSSRPR